MLIIPFRWTGDPQVAFLLSAVSGVVIFLNSVLYLSDPFYPYATAGLLAGAVIMGCAAGLRWRSRYRRELGAVILVVAFVSLFGVSGFYLGTVLGVLGGGLAIAAWRPSIYGAPNSAAFAKALGPPCGRCGKHVPSWTSRCPYCGYPE
jgi:hypothetical protein